MSLPQQKIPHAPRENLPETESKGAFAPGSIVSTLIGDAHPGFASLLLQIRQLLLRAPQGLLLGIDRFLFFAAVFRVFCRVAQLGSGVGVERGGTQALLALGYVQFALQEDYFIPLRLYLLAPVISFLLVVVRQALLAVVLVLGRLGIGGRHVHVGVLG